MSAIKTPKFPKRFMWGASISAHQTEGNLDNQWTHWELENAKVRASQAQYHYGDLPSWDEIKTESVRPDNYVSGKGIDHRSNYIDDLKLLRKLNLNSFRFSVEWSRIEPNEGAWDASALQYYKDYLAELKRQDIEPMVTLFHFTLPTWFADMGGFEKRKNVQYFVRFAEKVIDELGLSMKYIITVNEPGVYAAESYYRQNWPPAHASKKEFVTVLRNLLSAHNQTAKMIKAKNRRYKVAIAHNSSYVFPGDDALLSRASAKVVQYAMDDYILGRVRKNSDFIGVNYYFSDRVYGYRIHNEDRNLSDLGWDMHPENLEYVLERLWRKYKLPLIVTENGLADATDEYRKWWLMKTMVALSNAVEYGVDVRGYFHWSLLDNFEWAHGWWPKFGLVSVDQATGSRKIRSSAAWWAKVMKKVQE